MENKIVKCTKNFRIMNELSPRRFPRSPVVPPKTPPQWKKPQDVMRERKIRLKQNALLARINRSPSQGTAIAITPVITAKRKNPFSKCKEFKEPSPKKVKPETETSTLTESSILEILGFTETKEVESTFTPNSFSHASDNLEEAVSEFNGSLFKTLPVDWTLRTKMRFISPKPFPWTQMLKTSEEASGITGFVRCLESSNDRSGAGLDNSPNSRFHQNCLFWQHPHLPWLELYPRHNVRKSDKSPFPILPTVKDALYKEWSNSFRSLFQLVRTRHCPYFYMMTNTFTCLFRAAGISGIGETTAFVCPTSIGFQNLLRAEGINFSMPLRDNKNRRNNDTHEKEEVEEEIDEEEPEEDERGETEDWLASLGIPESEIDKIKTSEVVSSLKIVENSDDSLVVVDGSEVHSLFNFLINCKSAIATTGPLTGIPPTLISPVAFSGGTLLPLKVRESTVKQDNERFHTIEVRGPILPNTVHNLCSILQEELDTFSVTFANVDFTKTYSVCKASKKEVTNSPSKQTRTFSMESLADSGLDSKMLTAFCSDNLHPFDSLRCNGKSFMIL